MKIDLEIKMTINGLVISYEMNCEIKLWTYYMI